MEASARLEVFRTFESNNIEHILTQQTEFNRYSGRFDQMGSILPMLGGLTAPRHGPVLGVDGGNTKTIVVVAGLDGSVISVARGGCTDVYGVDGAEAALAELGRVVRAACAEAGTAVEDIGQNAFCLAGADWPEDHDLYREELARVGLARPLVVNDAVGSIHAGSGTGVGVAVAYGTYLAIGARSAEGQVWHSSFWAEPGGAHGLGSAALRAIYRAELGLEQPTSLSAAVPRAYGVESVQALLHSFTCRTGATPEIEAVRAVRVLLDEADRGDELARRTVVENGARAAEYAVAAARQVGLAGTFPLVFAGGVFRHRSSLLEEAVTATVRTTFPEVCPIRPSLPPVGGALSMAFGREGTADLGPIRERIEATLPADLGAGGSS